MIYCFEHIGNMVSQKRETGAERTHKDSEFDGMFQTCSVCFEDCIEVVHNLVLHQYTAVSLQDMPVYPILSPLRIKERLR